MNSLVLCAAALAGLIDVGANSTRCDWQTMEYETLDGVRGRMAHVSATAPKGCKVEIPLKVKGRYRIWLGTVSKRWAGYAMYVRLEGEKVPDWMKMDFDSGEPAERPVIGELEYRVADLDNDTLVIENSPGAAGGIAWVRLEATTETLRKAAKGPGMIATNDSFFPYSDKEEFLSPFWHFSDSPVKRILFCVGTGANAFPVRTEVGMNAVYDPSVPYGREIDIRITKCCEKLAKENPDLLKEAIDYVHSLGMEFYAYFRPGAAVDFRIWTDASQSAASKDGGSSLYSAANRCELWDGTPVARPSFAKKEVQDFYLRFFGESLAKGVDGINLAFTRALPTMLFEPAFRTRFREVYGEELKAKDDPRVIELRCRLTAEFLAKVKKLLGKRALSLTVLGTVERNRELGLDIAALAKAGVVDEFNVDGEDMQEPRKITVEKIGFEGFAKAVAGTKATVRPQFTNWWGGLDSANFRKAAEAGFAPACFWDGAHMPWQDWERIRRIDGGDFAAAEKWAKDHPDSWRVHRLKTLHGFDIVEYPWWWAF